MRDLHSQPCLTFNAQKHFKSRVSLPQIPCLNCVQSLDSALNYNMGSDVTGNHGEFNFGKKDGLFRVPVGDRFCLCWRKSRIIDSQLLEMESRFITTNFLNFTWISELFIAGVKWSQSFGCG